MNAIDLASISRRAECWDWPPARRWWTTIALAASRVFLGSQSRSTRANAIRFPLSSPLTSKYGRHLRISDRSRLAFSGKRVCSSLPKSHAWSMATIEQTGFTQNEGCDTDRRNPAIFSMAAPQEFHDVLRWLLGIRRCPDEHRVEHKVVRSLGLRRHAEGVDYQAAACLIQRAARSKAPPQDRNYFCGFEAANVRNRDCRSRGGRSKPTRSIANSYRGGDASAFSVVESDGIPPASNVTRALSGAQI